MTCPMVVSKFGSPVIKTAVKSTKGSARLKAGPASMTNRRCHTGFFMKSTSGSTIDVDTSSQIPGFTYTVTVASTVTDIGGLGVDAAASSAQFDGFQALPNLLITEVDYDMIGSDNSEFIELLNPTGSPMDLADYQVELVNGSTGAR